MIYSMVSAGPLGMRSGVLSELISTITHSGCFLLSLSIVLIQAGGVVGLPFCYVKLRESKMQSWVEVQFASISFADQPAHVVGVGLVAHIAGEAPPVWHGLSCLHWGSGAAFPAWACFLAPGRYFKDLNSN